MTTGWKGRRTSLRPGRPPPLAGAPAASRHAGATIFIVAAAIHGVL